MFGRGRPRPFSIGALLLILADPLPLWASQLDVSIRVMQTFYVLLINRMLTLDHPLSEFVKTLCTFSVFMK